MMQLAGERLSIEEACGLAQVSRAGFYRHFDEQAPRQAETELRDRIQRVALQNRCYGYRRVAAELRRQGVGEGTGSGTVILSLQGQEQEWWRRDTAFLSRKKL